MPRREEHHLAETCKMSPSPPGGHRPEVQQWAHPRRAPRQTRGVSGAAGGTGDVEGGGERVVRAAAGRLGGKSEGWGQRWEHWARWGHRWRRLVGVRAPSEADRAIRECEKPIAAVPH
mgnify:CR=1 FL=1